MEQIKSKLCGHKKLVLVAVGALLAAVIIVAVILEEPKLHVISSAVGKLTTSAQPSPQPLKHRDQGVYSHSHEALNLKGSGAQQTRQFTADSDWDLVWSYDCSNMKTKQSSLFISIYDSKGRVSSDTHPVIKFVPKSEGVEHFHKAGTYFLGIETQCAWSVLTRPAQ